MSDDEIVLDTSVAEVEPTENPEAVQTPEEAPETADQKVERLERELAKKEASFKKRIDKATKDKYELLGETKARMDALERRFSTPQPESKTLSRDQFDSDDEYVDARAEAKAEAKFRELEARVRAETQGREVADRSTKILHEAAKLGGFDVDDFVGFSAPISEALLETEIPAKLVSFLQLNPDEVERISGFSPAKQVIEIGKLEAKLLSQTAAKSNAPAPINRVKGTSAPSNGYRADMTDSEYAKWRANRK
jgi:hypothetical protein